jgi:hypothetical protein
MTVPAFDLHIFQVLGIVLAIILVDFLAGVLKSLLPPMSFSWQKFPGQLVSFILPYYIPLIGLAVVTFFAPVLAIAGVTGIVGASFYTFAAGVAIKGIADIGSKLGISLTPAPAPAQNQNPPVAAA